MNAASGCSFVCFCCFGFNFSHLLRTSRLFSRTERWVRTAHALALCGWGFCVYALLFRMSLETALEMCIMLCLFRLLLRIFFFFLYFTKEVHAHFINRNKIEMYAKNLSSILQLIDSHFLKTDCFYIS